MMLCGEDFINYYCTLPETNTSHLNMDGWNTIVSFRGPAYFPGVFAVSFRECINKEIWKLGGGFKHFLFSPLLLGEDSHVDDHIFQLGGSTTN